MSNKESATKMLQMEGYEKLDKASDKLVASGDPTIIFSQDALGNLVSYLSLKTLEEGTPQKFELTTLSLGPDQTSGHRMALHLHQEMRVIKIGTYDPNTSANMAHIKLHTIHSSDQIKTLNLKQFIAEANLGLYCGGSHTLTLYGVTREIANEAAGKFVSEDVSTRVGSIGDALNAGNVRHIEEIATQLQHQVLTDEDIQGNIKHLKDGFCKAKQFGYKEAIVTAFNGLFTLLNDSKASSPDLLALLGGQMQFLPDDERVTAWQEILKKSDEIIDAKDRITVLEPLTLAIISMPADTHVMAYKTILVEEQKLRNIFDRFVLRMLRRMRHLQSPDANVVAHNAILKASLLLDNKEYRASVLVMLTEVRLDSLQDNDLWNKILKESQTLGEEHGATVLAALAEQIWNLPVNARIGACKAILEAGFTLGEKHCATVLAALTWPLCAPSLYNSSSASMWNEILEVSRMLDKKQPAAVLVAMANQISSLPVEERINAWNDILSESYKFVDEENTAAVLTALAGQIESLPDNVRIDGFKRILSESRTLHEDHATVVLAILTKQIRYLSIEGQDRIMSLDYDQLGDPGPVGEDDECVKAWDVILDICYAFDGKHRASMLTALAGQIQSLPYDARIGASKAILKQASRTIDEEQRAAVLTALVGQIQFLISDDEVYLGVWDAILTESQALGKEHGASVQVALTKQIWNLPAAVHVDACKRILAESQKRGKEHGGTVRGTLTDQIDSLSTDTARVDAWAVMQEVRSWHDVELNPYRLEALNDQERMETPEVDEIDLDAMLRSLRREGTPEVGDIDLDALIASLQMKSLQMEETPRQSHEDQ